MSFFRDVDDSLRWSLTGSTVLHLAIVLTLYVGVPVFFKSPPPLGVPHRYIPFDIVDIGEITNTRIAGAQEEGAGTKPNANAPKAPEPAASQSKTTTPSPQQKPSAPEPAKDKVETIPDPNAPKPMQKPKPPEAGGAGQQVQPDQLTSVLKNVAKLKQTAGTEEPTKSDAKSIASKIAAGLGTSGSGLGTTGNGTGASTETGVGKGIGFGPALADRLMISEEDSLRRQISLCWNMPVGAREAENLVVEVVIEVNPDRTVREIHIVDEMRMNTDRYFRAAAEAAIRALRNPKCSPLALNPDKYDQWKTIRFNFDPRDML